MEKKKLSYTKSNTALGIKFQIRQIGGDKIEIIHNHVKSCENNVETFCDEESIFIIGIRGISWENINS